MELSSGDKIFPQNNKSHPIDPVKNLLLPLSLAINLALAAVCGYLFLKSRASYIDYRYFRALPVGSSDASTMETGRAGENQTVILFGDSRVEEWAPLPKLEQHHFLNAGVSGETTSEMRRRFNNDVIRLSPDTVIIQAGMNDLTAAATRGMPQPELIAKRMHENMHYFLTELADRNIRVIVTSIIPHSTLTIPRRLFWSTELTQSVTNSNAKFEKLAQDTNAEWLSLDSLFLDTQKKPVTEIFRDTLHLKKTGYEKLNHFILPHIEDPGRPAQ